jgi:ectoine hydroxylase-related dioxygenase (phytanoyl-CoA dioxygenase family)
MTFNKFWNSKGYDIIDLELTDAEINGINDDVTNILALENKTIQDDHYQYTQWPRLFEAWKKSRNIANLCMNEKILRHLENWYMKKAFPFSTINFTGPSNQPLHSDCIHFHTIPERMMIGVWVALEDATIENGALSVVPGSHDWDIYNYESLGLPHPDDIENGEEINYREYEKFIEHLVLIKKGKRTPVPVKKGEAIIWEANLLHGGTFTPHKDKTRKAQAIHYFFEGCSEYYHPMFSRPSEGKYAKKWCNENNNIRTYLEDIDGRI